jgi:sugar lactone lactonase YvrE
MPYDVILDRGEGALIVADSFNHRIRRLDLATHEVTTIAGTGQAALVDGPGASAAFNTPVGLALDPKGILYVGDAHNFGIRAVDLTDPAHPVTSIAGTGVAAFADGPGAKAGFNLTYGLALGDGVLYVADTYNHRIRTVDLVDPAHPVGTLAGSKMGRADGPGASAMFNNPQGLVLDAAGDLWVGDTANNLIRKISLGVPEHLVTTVAGTGEKSFAEGQGLTAKFAKPTGLAIDPAGDVWVTDTENQRVRNLGH